MKWKKVPTVQFIKERETMTADLATPSEITEFARNNGYDNARFLGEWHTYKVYEPVFNDKNRHYVGYPLSILKKNQKIRFTTEKECFEVLNAFHKNN